MAQTTATAGATEQETAPLRICPVCDSVLSEFAPGPGQRPFARCPICQALERHRSLALVLKHLAPYSLSGGIALEVAPSKMFRQFIMGNGHTYVGLDFDPAADGRTVNVQASLTDVPLADGSVDIALIYHVLEHIPDDLTAMKEITRILSAQGVAFVQVPWRANSPTDEDLSITDPEERTRRYGQADHVRYYGIDIEDRFSDAGIKYVRLLTRDIFSESSCGLFRLNGSEPIWVCAASQEVAQQYADRLLSWEPAVAGDAAFQALEKLNKANLELAHTNTVLKNRLAQPAPTTSSAPPRQGPVVRLARKAKRKLSALKK